MTERDRLYDIIKNMPPEARTEEEVTDYLLDNGVIVPPCRIGDTVYQFDTAGDVYESEVTQIIYNTKGIAFDERTIGRTVFLTREEAKSALEKTERR